METGSIDVETSDHHYDPATVPNPDRYYMPVQCHQCVNPPCVKVCPVEATWQEPDGITVIDSAPKPAEIQYADTLVRRTRCGRSQMSMLASSGVDNMTKRSHEL